MEETKYYTPAPEDIRPGMIYEYRRWPEEESCEWDKRVLPENGSIMQNILERLKRDTQSVRVPYLTSDQIEAEGWGKRTADGKSYYRTFNGGVWFYLYLRGDNEITIVRESQTEESYHGMVADWDSTKTDLYHGSCRCINDLRLISKLLGI